MATMKTAPLAKALQRALAAGLLTTLCAMGALPGAAHADPGTTDGALPPSIPLLVLVVGFDGGGDPQAAVPYDGSYDWSGTIFGNGDTIESFYRDMSGGAFAFTPASETSAYGVDGNANTADRANDGVVHITMHAPHGDWACVNEDSSVTREFCWTAMDMLAQASAYVDFASFDADADGKLEDSELALVLCMAGYEASSVAGYKTSGLPLTWAHAGSVEIIGRTDRKLDGLMFGPYIAIAENYWMEGRPLESATQEPLGILYHELGHCLGLPDLYATDDGTGDATWGAYSVGTLSLMAEGGWAQAPGGEYGWHYRPAALDAWSRYDLGWTTPTVVAESGDYTVSSQLSETGYSQLLVPTTDPGRYFLIENRQPEEYDEGISYEYEGGNARGGIVIWQVDETVCKKLNGANTVNAPSHHPGVMQLCYEGAGLGWGYTTDWATGSPVRSQPFYDATSWRENIGDAATALSLPAYSPDETDDTPAARVLAGVSISFPDESARDMTVHVEVDDSLRALILRERVNRASLALFGIAGT